MVWQLPPRTGTIYYPGSGLTIAKGDGTLIHQGSATLPAGCTNNEVDYDGFLSGTRFMPVRFPRAIKARLVKRSHQRTALRDV
jgi:hypothetical protein